MVHRFCHLPFCGGLLHEAPQDTVDASFLVTAHQFIVGYVTQLTLRSAGKAVDTTTFDHQLRKQSQQCRYRLSPCYATKKTLSIFRAIVGLYFTVKNKQRSQEQTKTPREPYDAAHLATPLFAAVRRQARLAAAAAACTTS